METKETKTDLTGFEGFSPESQMAPPTDELTRILSNIDNMVSSVGALHVLIDTIDKRVSTLERFVSYLLSVNPETAEKMKQLSQKHSMDELESEKK